MHNPKGPSTAPESHVTEEDLMSKPCESGNANASDVTPQGDQSFFFICVNLCVVVVGGGVIEVILLK